MRTSRAAFLCLTLGMAFTAAPTFAANGPAVRWAQPKQADPVPLEIRQFYYSDSVDRRGSEIADVLSTLFVYIHRNGGSLDEGFALRSQGLITKGLATDAGFRRSVRAWLGIFALATFADFDDLKSTEKRILSRDAYSTAILSSPTFIKRLGEISTREGFDFWPSVRREIKALQYGGNVVSFGGMGGAIFGALKALNLAKVGIALNAIPLAFVGHDIWSDLTHKPDDVEQLLLGKMPSAEAIQYGQSRIHAKTLREYQRRRYVRELAGAIQQALPSRQGKTDINTAEFLRAHAELSAEILKTEADLKLYQTRFDQDETVIKRADDNLEARAHISRSLKLILAVAELLKSASK